MKFFTSVLKSLAVFTLLLSLSFNSNAKSPNYQNQSSTKAFIAQLSAQSSLPSQAVYASAVSVEADEDGLSMKNKVNWLIIAVIVLLTMVIVLVFDILARVGDIQGKPVIEWNGINAYIMLGFGVIGLLLSAWEIWEHGKLTVFNQTPASEHGPEYDNMFMITVVITGIVFFITQGLLFWYAYKYKHSDKRKALFYPDNHKIELLWTIIPAIVLTILVVRGLKTWTAITSSNDPKAHVIEVYGYQFAWNARYAGEDNKLGKHDFRQIGVVNALGVDTNDSRAFDDVVTNEIHLPVGEPVMFKFRAKDVIHSAYLPHFRVQMNVVPGLPTQFAFTPTLTTAQMRSELNNPTFDYILLCNKICGSAHYRMKMKVVIHTKEDYKKWMEQQPKLVNRATAPVAVAPTAMVETAPATAVAN